MLNDYRPSPHLSTGQTALRLGRLILAVSVTLVVAAVALMAGTVVFLIVLGAAAFGSIAIAAARLLGSNDAVRFRLERHLKRRKQTQDNPNIIDVN